jgi:glucosamine 6-phosphate synthetase-like amidotransferase/phosphosugar isomerase protein
MCGIAGAIFSRQGLTFGIPEEKSILGLLDSMPLIDLVKSNEYFLYSYYYKNSTKFISDLVSQESSETQLDIEFYINSILPKHKLLIEKINELKIEDLSVNDVVFCRIFCLVLDAIDENLEVRGRDSCGVSIQVLSDCPGINVDPVESIEVTHRQQSENLYVTKVVVKVANESGRLGQNISDIVEIIKRANILPKLFASNWSSVSIMAHTRWATLGLVNLDNCHPITYGDKAINNISAVINGDIVNYFDFIDVGDWALSKSDSHVLPMRLSNVRDLKGVEMHKSLKEFEGSYAAGIQCMHIPDEVFLTVKGLQGLFIGIANDCLYFASDLYGFAEATSSFYRVTNDDFAILRGDKSVSFVEAPLDSEAGKVANLISLNNSDLGVANIQPRDISKKGYSHFLLKEITETELILQRSVRNFEGFDLQSGVVKRVKDHISSGLINKVVVTGMGSCYTAAVAIIKFFELSNGIHKQIDFSAEIASEASAFQLRDDMRNTLVIVVAQSGTTIDTNVYARKAKDRGATTIAIANKRNGDVTFIVEQTFYIGNGRDVELAVPSTKSYSAQILTGILLGDILFFDKKEGALSKIKQDLQNFSCEEWVEQVKNKFTDKLLREILSCKYWIITYDQDSLYSAFALELRIKLSECCYKTVSLIDSAEYKLNTNESTFVFHIGENGINNDRLTTLDLLDDIDLNEKYLSFLMLTIRGQVLAYSLALKIDSISKEINSKNFSRCEFQSIGIVPELHLSERVIIERLSRPIDTVRHQAKTITVGALRAASPSLLVQPFKYDDSEFERQEVSSVRMMKACDEILNLKYYPNIICPDKYKFFCQDFWASYHKSGEVKIHDEKSGQLPEFHAYDFSQSLYKILEEINIPVVVGLKNWINFFINLVLLKYNNPYISQLSKDAIHKDLANFLYSLYEISDVKSMKNAKKFINAIDAFNYKFLGSGSNYFSAKICADFIGYTGKIPPQIDVLENHKHIDMSAESNLIVFANNLNTPGYREDVLSEVSKMIAHKNETLLIVDKGEDYFNVLEGRAMCHKIHTRRQNQYFGAVFNLYMIGSLYE